MPLIAVTATATPAIQQCIADSLQLRDHILLTESFNRPNLRFEVRHKELIGDGTEEDVIQVANYYAKLNYSMASDYLANNFSSFVTMLYPMMVHGRQTAQLCHGQQDSVPSSERPPFNIFVNLICE